MIYIVIMALALLPVGHASAPAYSYAQKPEPIEEPDDPPDTPQEAKISPYCSCVETLRVRGVDLPKPPINAGDLEGNTTPHVGAVILLSYEVEHIALIEEITPMGFLVYEGNYEECEKGKREIPFNDPAIRGFYKKPNG